MFRHSHVTGIIDDTDTSITSNITTITMGHNLTPTTTASTSYIIQFNNALYHPHTGHESATGGVIASTGFKISGDTTNEIFFDDDGEGNLRTFYVTAGVRVYKDATAGTVDYTTGKITVDGIYITTISDVDGASSTLIRITAIPDSLDIVPVRNQILEIDFTNTTVTGEVDTVATGDSAAGTDFSATSAYQPTTSF
jgi:hypothetical protein